MEGCPAEQWIILYLVLSSMLIVCILRAFVMFLNIQKSLETEATKAILNRELQLEIYGERV